VTTFELGQTASVALAVVDSAGAAANLGSCACTVTRPDGTTTAATVTNPAIGSYLGALSTTQAGRHRFTFTGSGANSGALPWSDTVDVWPADPRLIISLADARAALNRTANVADDELRLYIAATTLVIEDIVGTVLARTVVEEHDGGKSGVLLDQAVVAVASVVVDGVTLTEGSGYHVKKGAGIVYAGSSRAPSTFATGRGNVVVTYSTGQASIDPNIILAAREEVAFLYRVGQQGARPGVGGGVPDTTAWTPSGFAVPTRVIELASASQSRRMPGIA
jgi:hypothetical protein